MIMKKGVDKQMILRDLIIDIKLNLQIRFQILFVKFRFNEMCTDGRVSDPYYFDMFSDF